MCEIKELSPSYWKELSEKFKVDWPQHIVGYSFLNNIIKRFERNSDETLKNVKVFTLDDSWRINATFIGVIVSNIHSRKWKHKMQHVVDLTE